MSERSMPSQSTSAPSASRTTRARSDMVVSFIKSDFISVILFECNLLLVFVFSSTPQHLDSFKIGLFDR